MLRDKIFEDILGEVSWNTSASTYQMIVGDLKSGEVSEEEFKKFLKAVCVEWGNRVEEYYINENEENSDYGY